MIPPGKICADRSSLINDDRSYFFDGLLALIVLGDPGAESWVRRDTRFDFLLTQLSPPWVSEPIALVCKPLIIDVVVSFFFRVCLSLTGKKNLYRALSLVHQAYSATRLTVATQRTFFYKLAIK